MNKTTNTYFYNTESEMKPSLLKTTNEISITPQILNLKVETTTDWPMVGATLFVGISTLAMTAVLTWLNIFSQKNQIRSLTAQFRKEWQVEIRDLLVQFISKVSQIRFKSKHEKGKRDNEENIKNMYFELLEIKSKIEIMLDPKKESTNSLIETMDDLTDLAWEDNDDDSYPEKVKLLKIESIIILEKTWQDIQNDLGKIKN